MYYRNNRLGKRSFIISGESLLLAVTLICSFSYGTGIIQCFAQRLLNAHFIQLEAAFLYWSDPHHGGSYGQESYNPLWCTIKPMFNPTERPWPTVQTDSLGRRWHTDTLPKGHTDIHMACYKIWIRFWRNKHRLQKRCLIIWSGSFEWLCRNYLNDLTETV